MHHPTLIWFDMTLATQHAEIEPILHKHFDVQHCTSIHRPDEQFDLTAKIGLCFEFDYPDRPGLELMCATKEKFPHLPVLMITAQHSERLAVWAYRNRVFDYLVKPVGEDDLQRCLQLLSAVQSAEPQQEKRSVFDFSSRIPTEIPVGQRSSEVRLSAAVRYVEKNFRGKIRNAEVAELCDMSQYHFSHEFTETFSLTFQEFVIRYRIYQACRELRHPNVAVTNVAYSVGFNDPSYFSRVFRRYTGCSPTTYCDQAADEDSHERFNDLVDKLDLPDAGLTNVERREQDRRYISVERR